MPSPLAAEAVLMALDLLSVKITGYLGVRDVCLSLPVLVGRAGTKAVRGVIADCEPPHFSMSLDPWRFSARIVGL